MMVLRIISLYFLFVCMHVNAQQYMTKEGYISFFSKAPLEDISAINNNVRVVYDKSTNDLVFELDIEDFIFPKSLMQQHFNENYLESDVYPIATFLGKIIQSNKEIVIVEGSLNIHGEKKKIIAEGVLIENNKSVEMRSNFYIKLQDFNINIPKIVTYKIAEEILVDVQVKLNKIK